MADLERSLQQGFKYFNRFMLLMWRLGLGPMVNYSPKVGGRIMVITHIGRKSGQRRQTPVNFSLIDGELYATAGFGKASDWYRNLMTNPQVEVWLASNGWRSAQEWWEGTAEDVSEAPNRLEIMRQVIKDSGFAGRMAGIDPYTMSDEELADLTASYRLVHIHRSAPKTGEGGPGDLAWVWPLAAMALLPLLFLRRGQRSKPDCACSGDCCRK